MAATTSGGAEAEAIRGIHEALEAGREGLEIAEMFPLKEITRAHEAVEHLKRTERVVIAI